MIRVSVIGLIVSLLIGSSLLAHTDPEGEIHPALLVRGDQLHLFYTKNPRFLTEDDKAVRHLRVLDQEFKVVSDSPVEEKEDLAERSLCAFNNGDWYFLHDELNGDPNAEFGRYLISTYGADGHSNQFTVAGRGSLGISTGLFVTENQIIVAANEQSVFFDPFGNPKEAGGLETLGDLIVVMFSRETRSEMARVSLGTPSRVVGLTPSSSAPVVHGGSVYVGWIKESKRQDGEVTRSTVISQWDLGTSNVKHRVVDEEVTWNTSVALCVFRDQIVMAYSDTIPDGDQVSVELRRLKLREQDTPPAESGRNGD